MLQSIIVNYENGEIERTLREGDGRMKCESNNRGMKRREEVGVSRCVAERWVGRTAAFSIVFWRAGSAWIWFWFFWFFNNPRWFKLKFLFINLSIKYILCVLFMYDFLVFLITFINILTIKNTKKFNHLLYDITLIKYY